MVYCNLLTIGGNVRLPEDHVVAAKIKPEKYRITSVQFTIIQFGTRFQQCLLEVLTSVIISEDSALDSLTNSPDSNPPARP